MRLSQQLKPQLKQAATQLTLLITLLGCGQLAQAQDPITLHTDQQQLLLSDDPKLASNKKLVFDFWREVFQTRDMTLAPKYMAKDYLQHNPNGKTGRQPFMNYFGSLPRQPLKDHIENLVMLSAEGDIVTLAFRSEVTNIEQPQKSYTTTWFDMFRIEDGKLAEHWDSAPKY